MAIFKNFVTSLELKLKHNLPGEVSQLKMAPITRLIELERKRTVEKPRNSAVLILFYPDNDTTGVILIKRAIDHTVHSGQISFPGGKFEDTDKDLKETALREAEEEIGLFAESVTIIGELSKLYIPPSNFDVFPFVGFVDHLPKLKGNHEVQQIIRVDFEALRNPATKTEKLIRHRLGKEVMVPSYYAQGETIWGATAMIISELLEVSEGL